MHRIAVPLLVLLAACGGAKSAGVTVTVSGVAMADVASIQAELGRLPGVTAVRPGAFKDGQAVFELQTARRGGDLAGDLAKAASGLKNVKGFDDGSVQVSYDGVSAPVAAAPSAAPSASPKPEEKSVPGKKDPLAYKMHQLPAGSIALFEGWQIQPVGSDGNWSSFVTCPQGKQNDFQLYIVAGIPDANEMAGFFETGPQYVLAQLPFLQKTGESKKCTFGGDEALLDRYQGEANGKRIESTAVYIKKKDVAVGVLGIGTPEAFKEYGRSVEIVAQSITVKDATVDQRLVGTWTYEKYYSSGQGTSHSFSSTSTRSLTFYPNGTFTESSGTYASNRDNVGSSMVQAEGGDRGRVSVRGNLLTLHYDNGKTWTGEYAFDGGALKLNSQIYFRQ